MAAPQVGIPKRVLVMNLGVTPFALVNPEIVWRSAEEFEVWDDCLGIPDPRDPGEAQLRHLGAI